jgi:DGQHR domain-containing protein
MILSMDLDFETIDNEIVEIEIPQEVNSCLIVDGQHRMKGFMLLHEDLEIADDLESLKILNEFKFNCTILVNFDIYEQAKIFANVNFNQKPVDRSLYFDIFGEIKELEKDEEKSSLYIAHELGKYLNTSIDSPIRGFVKNYSSKKGFVSQAFLMQALLNHLGPRGTWSEITEDYKNNGKQFMMIPKIYVAYFRAIQSIFTDYWPKGLEKNNSTVICKTTGLSALIKLLGHIDKCLKFGLFPNYKEQNLMEMKIEEITVLFTKIFSKETFKGNAKKYFGNDSKFAGAGAGGLQNELFHLMAEDLGISARRK